jgi:glycosyltransferase involved in cell wall biosynthesis
MNLIAPQRILFFISEDWYFWSHRRNIAAAARREGYDVWLATRVGELETAIRNEGIHLVRLRWFRRRTQNLLLELRSLLELVAIYRRLRPDIVHHVALKPTLMGLVAARLTTGAPKTVVNALGGLGVLFSKPGRQSNFRQGALLRCLRILTVSSQTTWITQNTADREILVNARITPRSKTTIIPGSGADPDIFRPHSEPPGPPLVLLASRLLWPKGIETFIRAARAIKREGISARFAIAGPVDDENPDSIPETYIRRWVQRDVIEYWGYINDMPSALRSVHIFCLPTYYGEGIPKVLIEAGACGIPAVTSDIPGCRAIIEDGINGLLVPPQNVPALSTALVRLITENQLRVAMKDRARQIFLERFTDAHVTTASLKVWDPGSNIGSPIKRPFSLATQKMGR